MAKSRSSIGSSQTQKPPGPRGRFFLLFCRPLPAFVSLYNITIFIRRALALFRWLLVTVLVFSAPLAIPLLVWMALGAGDSEGLLIELPWQQKLQLPALSTPAAFGLLAVVSAAIHMAQLTRHAWRSEQEAATAAALTQQAASQRPQPPSVPSTPLRVESPFQTARKISAAQSEAAKSDSGMQGGSAHGTAASTTTETVFSQLYELQKVLFGEEKAVEFSKSVPRTFENAAFETGRLCAIVGVDAPIRGGGSAAGLDEALVQLKSALT